MFRVHNSATGRLYRAAIAGLLILSVVALVITVRVELDFLREQEIVQELIKQLPDGATAEAEALVGELRWQFRLTTLVVLNLVVTGFAVQLLWRAYRSSQESLRDIKVLAGDILNSMNQAVITTDVAGHVTSINRRGLELLAPATESVGRPLREISSVVPLHTFHADWKADSSSALTRDFTADIHGMERTLRAFCQTLRNYDGDATGHVLQLRDVTEHGLIEERMRRMERYMGLGSLAAGLHHEIKNPLAALSLHVQLLEEQIEDGGSAAEVRRMLSVIRSELSRVLGVLEGFRDFASIGRLEVSPVNVREMIERQVELVAPRAERQHVTIDVRTSVRIVTEIVADRVRLDQVLLNLLINALEAMPDGGRLSIDARTSDGIVRIEVADTGRGIPADMRDRIFDPYFTTKSEGTGLGLALCDKIVRQHHGRLELRTASSGTVFQVMLPVLQDTDELSRVE